MSTVIAQITTESECSDVRALVVAHLIYERSSTRPPENWGARAAALIASGRLHIFVASVDGRTVGYASLTAETSTWTTQQYGHLDCLFVEATRRGEGIGRRLFAAVAEQTRSLGMSELQWQTPEWNHRATAFYRRTGATSSTKERFSLTISPATRRP